MKFGKQLQSQRIPSWEYVDYKSLKKTINSLSISREPRTVVPAQDGSPTSLEPQSSPPVHPPPAVSSAASAASAPFFFKLERELDKINNFYLLKQSDLSMRLRTLLEKRNLLVDRGGGRIRRESSSWLALCEGFRNLEKDLSRLQQYTELNATAFRKILKKFDKRSKLATRELYLARQVEVQPAFNREELIRLSDVVSRNLVELQRMLDEGGSTENVILKSDPAAASQSSSPMLDRGLGGVSSLELWGELEMTLTHAVRNEDQATVSDTIERIRAVESDASSAGSLAPTEAKAQVQRIFWKAAVKAKPRPGPQPQLEHSAPLPEVKSNTATNTIPAVSLIPVELLDFAFLDDINSRTSLHVSSIAGRTELVKLCLDSSVQVGALDAYGRTALHYASMNGFPTICGLLIDGGADPHLLDLDGYSAAIYAVINGRSECVKIFMDKGATLESSADSVDLDPLGLACQYGHLAIVETLLSKASPRLRPNGGGLYPQHLAAKEGHAEVLQLLISSSPTVGEIVDVPDKYHGWTPVFHAANEGKAGCIRALLEAGCDLGIMDELGKTAIHYAGWQSHIDCLNLLLSVDTSDAAAKPVSPTTGSNGSVTDGGSSAGSFSSPLHYIPPRSGEGTATTSSGGGAMELDPDNIPSLSLPPPIMPFRTYGHNYLDKKSLVQLTLGHPNTSNTVPMPPAVKLYGQESQLSCLKLLITSKPDSLAIPHSVILPLSDERELFSFQISSFDTFSLEFDLYPTFGSQVLARAVAHPHLFSELRNHQSFVVPLLNPHLKVVGELSFELSVVKPFEGVQLEIGGQIETYWKSQVSTSGSGVLPLQTSSAVVTASSLTGEHINAVIQVTRDGIPVVYPHWDLPLDAVTARVNDVTVDQFLSIAKSANKEFEPDKLGQSSGDAKMWHKAISQSLLKLETLLGVLPESLGIDLEIRYPTRSDISRLGLYSALDVNKHVDAVLVTVYKARRRRRLVFSSFNPVVCTALNWKQPNYAVFFASHCGLSRTSPPRELLPANRVEHDRRCTGIAEAVKFAKANNLLGVMLDATILIRVPSLIQSCKEQGLLVTTFGSESRDTLQAGADAHMLEGILSYPSSAFLDAVAP